MNILVCVKRIPAPGSRILLTPDEQEIDTRLLGFDVSPHEECAVEEAVRLVEKLGGASSVLTLGPEAAAEQLRYAMAQGIDNAILLETDGGDWDAQATARAIAAAIAGRSFDLLLFGNESADTAGFQVGIRVAHALGLPCICGVKEIAIADGMLSAKRPLGSGWEVYETPLPAVVTVKEGINYPRYPSLPGKLRAKKKPIERVQATQQPGDLKKVRLATPKMQESVVQILGEGPTAAPRVVELLKELGMV
jgi:electron transfer flavoprotein beta subunit